MLVPGKYWREHAKVRGNEMRIGQSARDAWVSNEIIRQWFEIVIGAAFDPHQHRAYICKSCWQIFNADEELWTLQDHIEAHGRWGGLPYDSPRPPRSLTGEQLVSFHQMLIERFDTVIPEAGTWKFECKACKKRFPHRTDYRALVGHFSSCEALEMKGPIQ